jgi:hypothetical protein
LNSALEDLAKKTLILQPFDDVGSDRSSSSPEPRTSGRNLSVDLARPEYSPVEYASIGAFHDTYEQAKNAHGQVKGLSELHTGMGDTRFDMYAEEEERPRNSTGY